MYESPACTGSNVKFTVGGIDRSRLEAKGPVIKATKPTAFSGGETITIR